MRTKKADFKPIVIGHLTHEEKQFKAEAEKKVRLYGEFFDYIQRLIRVEDRIAFKSNLYASFIDEFTAKFEGNFPPQLSVRKQLELMEVDTARMEYLIREIEAIKIDIDLNTGQPTDVPEFRVFTKSEQENKLYKYLTSTIAAIEEGKEFGIHVYPSNICSAFSGYIGFDFEKNCLVPNVARIQGNERKLY
jgi:hypothetical protein